MDAISSFWEPRTDKGGLGRSVRSGGRARRLSALMELPMLNPLMRDSASEAFERRQAYIRSTGYIYVCERDRRSRIRSLDNHSRYLSRHLSPISVEKQQQHRAMQDDMD